MSNRDGWKIADPNAIESFSALHFSFGFRLHQELKVPVGLMVGAVGGTPSGRWLSEAMVKADKNLAAILDEDSMSAMKARHTEVMEEWRMLVEKAKAAGENPPRKPRGPITIGDLYERHIEYMVPYGIRGVLWDQGEARTQLPDADQYTTMNALISGWRRAWGQGDFCFLHVQKPSGGSPAFDPANPVNLGAVEFTDKLPAHFDRLPGLRYPLNHIRMGTINNAPLVQTFDLASGVHPTTKSGYGSRACGVALGAVYGRDVAISGPQYKSHNVDGNQIRVRFDHVGKGLAFKHGDKLLGFEIGDDKGNWAWADGTIEGGTVVVSSKDIPNPTKVQYAFNTNRAYANLYNKDGLPAIMFATSPPSR